MDSVVSVLTYLLPFLSSYPVLAKVIVVAVGLLAGVPGLFNAVIVLWHAVVGVVSAVAAFSGVFSPGGSAKLASLAASLKADSDALEAKASPILAFLNRVSSIPLPQAPSQPPAA